MIKRYDYLDMIKVAKEDAEILRLIGKIYDCGYEDGVCDNEQPEEARGEPIPWEDLD